MLENCVANSVQEQAAPVPQPFSWSEDRVNLLMAMVKSGATARQAGDALGISRNAAIGKAQRLGMKFGNGSRSPLRGERRPKPQPTYRLWRRSFYGEAPESLDKPILELKAHECRYPVTDDKPHLFCAQPVEPGQSYCGFHFFICTRPNTRR